MPRIQQLPEAVANQIAAGEVVERPVAVIKELVENSLDAGATQLEVEFRQGGKSLMRVTDNGCGMDAEDALACLRRHATSKIRSAHDLQRIQTFGFRGEALPSIASVSRFTLRTRPPAQAAGTEVLVNGGREPQVRDCGMAPGTSIEVAQLFNSVPARRKFLKTDRTEAAHIVQLVRLLAVAHPQVAFTLVEDGRPVLRSPICPTVRARVAEVFGRGLSEGLIEIHAEEPGLKLSGLIGRPGNGRATRAELNTYVNLRPVESRVLTYALIESYHSYIPKGRYPIAFLFLEVDPAAVDVNVHPAKREVRFRDEAQVRRFVMESVLAHLRQAARPVLANARPVDPLPSTPPPATSSSAAAEPWVGARPPPPVVDPSVAADAAARDLAGRLLEARRSSAPESRPTEAPAALPLAAATPSPVPLAEASALASPIGAPAGADLGDWRFLGLISGQTFGLFETPEGLVTVAVRAARERIAYERILRQLRGSEAPRQALLFALPLEFDPVTSTEVEGHLDFFARLGFELEPFGRNLWRLAAVPAWFAPEEAEAFVRDLAELLRERGLRPDQPDLAREAVARLAAERAARLEGVARPELMPGLAAALLSCRQPLTDPRGRPTLWEVRHGELRKRFGDGT